MKLLKYCPYCTRPLSFASIIRQRLFAKDKEAITCKKCKSVISTSGAAKVLPLFQEVVISGGVFGSAMALGFFTDHLAIPIFHHLGMSFDALNCGFIAFVVIFLLLTYYLAPIRSS